MNIKTVTTFNKRLYDEYAHRFMSTYNWPFELIVYSEDEIPDVKTFNTFDLIPKCKNLLKEMKLEKYQIYMVILLSLMLLDFVIKYMCTHMKY